MYAEFDGQELGNCDGIGLEGNIEVALQNSVPMYILLYKLNNPHFRRQLSIWGVMRGGVASCNCLPGEGSTGNVMTGAALRWMTTRRGDSTAGGFKAPSPYVESLV